MKNRFLKIPAIGFTVLMLVIFITITGSRSANAGEVPQTLTFKILVTTDVHGAIFPYDFVKDSEAKTSLAQVMTFVKQRRADKDQEVILLDNGDILQGQPIVYYYNFEVPDKTHICAQVMNYMKYDAGSVGNHDIEAGHAVYDKIVHQFKFPWLSANTLNTTTLQPYFVPYTVIRRKGIKIAVLGLTTPSIPNWLPEKIWEGMVFEDMVETAKKWIKIIREKEKPDLMIGLFHSGVDYTYGDRTADTPKNENASQLVAERVPGFDAVFAGHDHQEFKRWLKDPQGKDVLLLDPLSSAKAVAVVTVTLKRDSAANSWRKEIKGEIVETRDFPPDREMESTFSDAIAAVKAYVSKKIGVFIESISSRDSMFGDSAFSGLIHRIQLEITGADMSFAAPLSFNATIKKGDVFVRDLFQLYRYENLLYTMELTGTEIRDYLEYSYGRWFNTMVNANDHLLNFKRDENGKLKQTGRDHKAELEYRYYSFDSAAGIVYEVNVSKPVGKRISILSLQDGTAFDPGKKYRVAINSYRGTGGGGHLTRGAGIPVDQLSQRILQSTTKDLRYFMMKWIEKNRTITPKAMGNWKVVPEKWWQKAKEKDYKLLYGN
jgi:2',3'-cyclic-nucleotide 2'-phosphodiesterase / 3'-nucleotidase